MKKLSIIAAEMGRKGGRSKSELKRIAAEKNGHLGGRPRKNLNEMEADLADEIGKLANDSLVTKTQDRRIRELTARLWKIVDITNNVLRKHGRMERKNIHESYQGIHTCHDECPCQPFDGVERDFVGGL